MMRTLVLFAGLAAAQPRMTDAKVESRPLRGSLAQEVAAIEGPAWVAYSVPAVPHEWSSCNWRDGRPQETPSPVMLEGFKDVLVFVRVEARKVAKVRHFSPNCEIDAGGLPVLWLSGVSSASSVAFLKTELAVDVIGLHQGPEADAALEDFVSARHGDKIRKQAAFWLGSTRKQRGVDLLTRLLREDPGEKFRLEVVFALSRSKEGLAVLIDAARRKGGDAKVREKAMFWLARSDDAAAKRFVDQILQ